jgi:signal transduction histidine kinase
LGKIFNLLLVRTNGEQLPVSVTTSPVLNDQDQITRVVVVFRDDTEQRRIDRMRTEFVSVTSHQLRTPLTSIKWYVELMDDPATSTNLTQEQQKFLKQIDESNSRMIELVNDLLNVSRIETGTKFDLKPEQTDIIKLIQSVVEEQMVIANQRKVTVNLSNNDISELNLNIDASKVRQIVMNLLNNAIKYSPENNTVELRWHKDGQYFNLEIQDHGIGIPLAEQERVFEKFFRAANAVSKQTEGTGLGTYISRSIARAHGGDVSFVSVEGQGSTFTLKLPLQSQIPVNPTN